MRRSQKGFTLIEVVVAMAILAFLSLFTVQAIQRGLAAKTKIQRDIDKTSMLRDALRVMERDINLAFNHRDVGAILFNEAQTQRKKLAETPSGTGPGAIPTAPPDPTRFRLRPTPVDTQFVGEPNAVSFTSLSNVRMTDDQIVSSQAEIGYRVKPCRRVTNSGSASSPCLWRRVSNYIHQDITRSGEETVLLENVEEFRLRYLGPNRNGEWADTWITSDRGMDDTTKNIFPLAVEVTVGVKDLDPKAKDKMLKMTIVASIRNPNNQRQPIAGQNNQGTNGQNQAAPTN